MNQLKSDFEKYQFFYWIDLDLAPFISEEFPDNAMLGIAFREDNGKIYHKCWVGKKVQNKEHIVHEGQKENNELFYTEFVNPLLHSRLLSKLKQHFSQISALNELSTESSLSVFLQRFFKGE